MLILFHDYTSPASAVATLRLQRLADEGMPVGFSGFEAVSVDVTVPLPADVPCAVDEVADDARALGLRLRRPRSLPPTGPAHLVGGIADRHGLGAAWREACYRAYWEQLADIGDPHVLVRLAARAGLSPDEVRAALSDPARLAETRRSMAARRREGVGGVPTILAQFGGVGDVGGAGATLIPGLLPEPELRALAVL